MSDEDLERLYRIARMTPEQAARFFGVLPVAEARWRLGVLKALPFLMEHERVELQAHAARLGEPVTIERALLSADALRWEPL